MKGPNIPNHEKQTIWDTKCPSEVPLIFEKTNLGYILSKNTSQIAKNRPFGIQNAPQKYPKCKEIACLGCFKLFLVIEFRYFSVTKCIQNPLHQMPSAGCSISRTDF